MVRPEGFEPPAFWSVAALKGEMQAFLVLSEPIASGSISFPTLFCPLAPPDFFLFWVKASKRIADTQAGKGAGF